MNTVVEPALTSAALAFASDFARRLGSIIATLRTTIGRGFVGKLHLFRLGAPLSLSPTLPSKLNRLTP
jgi:hypothetical protein